MDTSDFGGFGGSDSGGNKQFGRSEAHVTQEGDTIYYGGRGASDLNTILFAAAGSVVATLVLFYFLKK
jgi:hypothetical protein